jgi:sterol desaturase/sphingolipid hydroxylase (fatty acid hydroxylase superfamily)
MTVVILCSNDFVLLHITNGTKRQECKRFIVSINNSLELGVYVTIATVLQSILSSVCSVGSVKMLFLSVVEYSCLFTLLKLKHVHTLHHHTALDNFGPAMNIG